MSDPGETLRALPVASECVPATELESGKILDHNDQTIDDENGEPLTD